MTISKAQLEQDAALVSAQFRNRWGGFRRFIAAHPLTGFWIGTGFGAAVVGAAWRLF